MNSALNASSGVNAFWKASSWSPSRCWTYLSPIPHLLEPQQADEHDDEDAPDSVLAPRQERRDDEALDQGERVQPDSERRVDDRCRGRRARADPPPALR